MVVAYPVNQAACWIFRAIAGHDSRHYVSGLKKAFIFTIAIPLMAGFCLIYSYLWGFGPAINHILYSTVTSLLLLHMVFINSAKIPFVNLHKNSNHNHRILWPPIFIGAFLFTTFFSKLGIFLIKNPEYYLIYYLAVMAIYFMTRWVHYYYYRELVFTYNAALQKVIVGFKLDPKK